MHQKHLFWSYKHVRKLSYLFLFAQKLNWGGVEGEPHLHPDVYK